MKTKKIVLILLNVVFLFTVAFIIHVIVERTHAKETSSLITSINIDENEVTPEKTENILKLEKLQEQNSDIKAYLEINDTNISYPILQAKDNEYYMNRDYKKESSKIGSLFLDKSVNLEKPSENFLIYGHNNKDGSMFADLTKYKDQEFYNNHKRIRFITNKEDKEYEVIAVFLSRVYYKTETNVFRYYYFINASNKEEFENYVKNAKKDSLYQIDETAQYGDQLLTLSTCYYHTEDGRFVVVAKKVQ